MTLLASPAPRAKAGESTRPILERIEAADRILQSERGAIGLLRALPWLLAAVPGAFAIDVILHLAAGSRLAITIGLVFASAALLGWQAMVAWVRRNPPEHTARVLESRDPELGSNLINLLQLREQTNDPRLAPFTRQLAQQAVDDCAAELKGVDLLQLARSGGVRTEAKRAAIALLLLAAVLAAAFEITRAEVPRFLDPFGDHPPYSFTRLEIIEPAADGFQVTYGGNLLVTARASGHHPADLFLGYYPTGHPEQVATVPMLDKGERGFAQQLEGIKTDLAIFAQTRRGQSVSKHRRISVALAPKLEHAWVKITPPAYTGLAAEERPLQFKDLKVLEGSAVQFRLQSNRPLGNGRLEIIKTPQETQSIALSPSATNEVTGLLTPTDSARLRFTLVDLDGHPSEETWELSLNVTHDLPPDVQITEPPGDSFVAMDFKVNVIAEASDDYGVKVLRIHQARNDVWVEPKVTTPETISRNVRGSITLDFKQMDIEAGDTFSFFAEAIDTAPEAHLARTPVVTLTVISTEDYNSFLREQIDLSDVESKYSDLFNQLHDLTDEQRKLGEQIDALKQQMAAAKDPAALAPKLDEMLARQSEINAKLNKLADVMETFVREKPLYDIETDLQGALQEKAQQVRDSTKQNDSDTQKVSEQSSSPSGGRQMSGQTLSDFKKASDDQLQRLGAAEEQARDEVQKPLEEMSKLQEIMKDFNQVEDLYHAQHTLEQQAKAYDRPGPLSREDQLALKDLAAAQKQIGDELEKVASKLSDDSEAAKEKFPKAAQSARDLSDRMADLRLGAMANQATEAMLAGRGDNGAQLASRLSGELEKLFSTCQSQGGQMSGELDQYLNLSRSGMKPGNSFKQMMQNRKLGNGKSSIGRSGPSGRGGSAVMMAPNAHVLGNETAVSHESSQSGAKGLHQAQPGKIGEGPALDNPDVMKGVPAINRESGAIEGESSIEQYGEIVDKYFKAITKPAPAK